MYGQNFMLSAMYQFCVCTAMTSSTELLELPSSANLMQIAKINTQGNNFYLIIVMSMSFVK